MFKNEMKRLPVTYGILIVTVLSFLVMQVRYVGMATTSQAVFDFGGLFGRAVQVDSGQLWRLVTPIFVHIGWDHAVMNILSIYIVGQFAENIWGSKRFLFLYLLSGVMGNIFTLFFTPDVVAAGASTALFGSFAAIVIVGKMGKNVFLKGLGRSYTALIVVNLIFNLFSPNVSLVGHIGGLVGGFLTAIFAPNLVESDLFSKKQRYLALVFYLLLAYVLLFLSLS
ncbi:rhomboid family intramembrane serine protease [Streptococcus cameli]